MVWTEPARDRRINHSQAIARMAQGSVVLLGEQHDRPQDHRFQELTLAGLAALVPDLRVGFEMFPRSVQPVLDAWAGGRMSEAGLLRETEWETVWGFPAELYLPLFRLCRDLGLGIFAMNVARPVVSLVGREGWQALPEEYRSWLSPAVPASPAYRRYLFEITGGVRPGRKAQGPEDPAFDTFVRAQQVWDRAFACAIAAEAATHAGACVAGIIGRGHLEYRLGVTEQLDALGVGPVTVALPHGDRTGTGPVADLVFMSGEQTHYSSSV